MAQYTSGPKKYTILTLTLVVVMSLFFVYIAVMASSTIGTNMSTTGTLDVTGVTTMSKASLSANFEATGYASISGNLQFGGVGTHTIGVNTGSGALTINAFTLGGTVTGPLVLTGAASVSTNFEVTSYASIGGNATFAGTGSSSFAGGLKVTKSLFANLTAIIGSTTASNGGNAVYTLEAVNTTGTNSLNFSAAGGKGTCIQMNDIVGIPVYLRVVAGAAASASSRLLDISTKKCR